MEYVEKFDYEGLTDDVCNSRQIIEKLLVDFDLNALAGDNIQLYANCISNFHNAISSLRQIEILLEI